jgi:hypothetical protein
MNTPISRLRSALALLVCAGCGFAPATAAASEAAADSTTLVASMTPIAIERSHAQASGFGSYSGSKALGVGLLGTLGPAALAATLNRPGSNSEFAWEASLALGITTGVLVGPAIGLASGGRGDLAGRGLLVRGLGLAAVGAGVLGIVSAFDESSNTDAASTTGLVLAGCAGAVLVTVSSIYDLAITPSAVERGRAPRAELGVRPDGKVAVSVRF